MELEDIIAHLEAATSLKSIFDEAIQLMAEAPQKFAAERAAAEQEKSSRHSTLWPDKLFNTDEARKLYIAASIDFDLQQGETSIACAMTNFLNDYKRELGISPQPA